MKTKHVKKKAAKVNAGKRAGKVKAKGRGGKVSRGDAESAEEEGVEA